MTLEQLIEVQFRKLGAVRAEVNRNGIATHWQSPGQAYVAKGKFVEMGLRDVEIFNDHGCFAVFGRFADCSPLPERESQARRLTY